MNAYEQKLEDRKDRYLDLAEANREKSNVAYGRADMRESASGIPLGQPILIGHHSEGRHRAAIKRADNAMRASIDADKKADYYENKAAGVGRAGISSDDPEAVAKLKTKIENLERQQEQMKAGNKIVKAAYKAGCRDAESGEVWGQYVAALKKLNQVWDESAAYALLKPDFAGRRGYAPYQLTNNNANIRRLKLRLKGLEAKEGAETKTETLQGMCEIVQNVEMNRIQFIFDAKPSAEIRAILKGKGFRWAPSQNAWQRHLNANGKYAEKLVVKALSEL